MPAAHTPPARGHQQRTPGTVAGPGMPADTEPLISAEAPQADLSLELGAQKVTHHEQSFQMLPNSMSTGCQKKWQGCACLNPASHRHLKLLSREIDMA
jgi:hypothetical protein